MANPISAWRADHANYARLVECLEREAAVLGSGNRPDYELMISILTYLTRYPDRHHHPREEEVFARLARLDPGLRSHVQLLHLQHAEIAIAGQLLLQQLEEALNDDQLNRIELAAAAQAYVNRYLEHIAAEDTRIIPRAAAMLTQADWEAVLHADAPGPDPLFGMDFEPGYAELRRAIAARGSRA